MFSEPVAATPRHSIDALQTWDTHIDTLVDATPLISLRAGHNAEREHTRDMLFLYSSVFVLALAVSLDSMSFPFFLNYALSEFHALSSIGTIMIVQQLVRAVSKPMIAKLCDAFGRIRTLVLVAAMYGGGYALMASAAHVYMLFVGTMVQAFGATGLGVLQSIIIADTSSVQWRGFLIGIVNVPYLLNFALVGPTVQTILQLGGWRFGLAVWVVAVPLAAAPLGSLLLIGQRRAEAAARERRTKPPRRSSFTLRDLDLLGMGLLSVGLTLVLLPISLHGLGGVADARQPDRYSLLLGFAALLACGWWERRAPSPMLPPAILSSFHVGAVCFIAAVDFAGFYLSWAYLAPFIAIVKPWDAVRTAYFVTTQNVVSTVTGVVVGTIMAYTRRLKSYMIWGFLVRVLGALMMVRFRTSSHTAIAMLTCQILQGIGGGAIALTTQVAVQVAVPPGDVAAVTAFELLTTELGAAFGSAAASTWVTTALPRALAAHLPALAPAELRELEGNLDAILAHPLGSDIRTGVVDAWVHVMQQLCLLAVAVQLPGLLLTFFVPELSLHSPASTHAQAHAPKAKTPSCLPPPWRTERETRSCTQYRTFGEHDGLAPIAGAIAQPRPRPVDLELGTDEGQVPNSAPC